MKKEIARIAGVHYTLWEAVDWVEEKFGVTYTCWGMRWVFERLDLKKRKIPWCRMGRLHGGIERKKAVAERKLQKLAADSEKMKGVVGYGYREASLLTL